MSKLLQIASGVIRRNLKNDSLSQTVFLRSTNAAHTHTHTQTHTDTYTHIHTHTHTQTHTQTDTHTYTYTHRHTHTQTDTHTHTHDDNIRRNAMRCISPKNDYSKSLWSYYIVIIMELL